MTPGDPSGMVAPLSSQRLQLDCAEWPILVGVSAETFREAAQFLWGDVSRLDDVERVSGQVLPRLVYASSMIVYRGDAPLKTRAEILAFPSGRESITSRPPRRGAI